MDVPSGIYGNFPTTCRFLSFLGDLTCIVCPAQNNWYKIPKLTLEILPTVHDPMKPVPLNLDTLGRGYDFFTWKNFLRLVRYPILHRVYLQIWDDLEAKRFTKYTLIIFVNSLWRSGSETLQKKNYRQNSAMTQFRMIPEPYLAHSVYPKV